MLSLAVLVIYMCGCLWLAASVWRSADRSASHVKLLTGSAVAALGMVLHGILVLNALFAGSGMQAADGLSLVGWGIALVALIAGWRQPRFAGIGALLILIAGLAAAYSHEGITQLSTTEPGWALTTHVVIAIVAYALIAIGALFAVALALLDGRLRKHRPLGLLASLPSLEALEAAMFQTISLGFALLTLTLFSGFIFVNDLLAQHLAHKVALSCLAWVILGVLLLGRSQLGWRGRVAARWALAGFGLLLLAYFGSKFVLEVILGRSWG